MTKIILGYNNTGDCSDDEHYDFAENHSPGISMESTDHRHGHRPATVDRVTQSDANCANDETKEMAPKARKASSKVVIESRHKPEWATTFVQVQEAKKRFEDAQSKNGRSYQINYTLPCCLIILHDKLYNFLQFIL